MEDNILHLFLNSCQNNQSSQLEESARQLHNLYESYINAGFNKQQAFDLVKTMMCQAIIGGRR